MNREWLTTRCRRGSIAFFLILPLPACVPEGDGYYTFDDACFNEHIRADFQPLPMADVPSASGATRWCERDSSAQARALKYGSFRDGGDGGPVSEVYPVSALAGGPAHLVQASCLFVGTEFDSTGRVLGSDELRMTWELIGHFSSSREDNAFNDHFQTEISKDLGLCSSSTPANRLLFENPGADPYIGNSRLVCDRDNPGEPQFWLTLSRDPYTQNIPLRCVIGHMLPQVVLRAFSPAQPDPDGRCPEGHFSERPREVTEDDSGDGWFRDGAWSVCGYPPNHVYPVQDSSYHLSLKSGHSFGASAPERWLSPNVMQVDGQRGIARQMEEVSAGTGSYRWSTPVEQITVEETGSDGVARRVVRSRWAENYTPTLQVKAVSIVSRDDSGAERVETTKDPLVAPQLTIFVPRSGAADASITCTNTTGRQLSFRFPDDCGVADMPDLQVLTPTYAKAFLDDSPPVTVPITWAVSLPGLPGSGRTPFVRFDLKAVAQPGTLRISPVRDFGRLQRGHWRQGELMLENIGGQPLEVQSITFDPTSPNTGDFSFVVLGDPVDIPLPIEARGGPEGALLIPAEDAADAPIVNVTPTIGGIEVALGDPGRGSATQALSVYGHPARFVGRFLIRDDPRAVYAPAAPADPRPFTVSSYTAKQTPFVLRAGQTVRIAAIVQPTQLGVRRAGILVKAVSAGSRPTRHSVIGRLQAEAFQGPQLHLAPAALWFNRTAGDGPVTRRGAFVDNVGSAALDVTRMQLSGRDAARFSFESEMGSPPFRLATMEAANFWVTYTPECDGSYGSGTSSVDHEATLVVDSTGGRVELRLQGSSYGYCELP